MRELPRRIFHFCSGLIIPVIGLLVRYDIFLIVLITLTALAIIIDFLRLKSEKVNFYFILIVGPFIRRKEVHRINGSTYLLVASTVAFLLFGKDIAATALIFLGVGDPIAGMIGTRWGKIRINKKSLEGSLAFFISAFAAGALLIMITHIPLYIIALGAFGAAVVELLSLTINDNLSVPLVSGCVILGLLHFFGS